MQQKIFIPKGLTVNDPFFYIIRHKPSNKLYAGYCSSKRWCDSEKFLTSRGYKTSSKIIKRILNKEGFDSFIIDRIRHFKNGGDALRYEAKFLEKVNARNNNSFFNQSNGSINFRTGISNEEMRKVNSRNRLGMIFWNNGSFSKRARTCPGEGWVRGRFLDDNQKEIYRDGQKGMKNWTNGIDNFRGKECPGDGWVLGKVGNDDYKNKMKKISSNRKWWNNGKEQTMSKNYPGDGWIGGMLPEILEKVNQKKRDSMKDKKHWNNGVITIRSKECPGNEWCEGIYVTPERKQKIVDGRKNTTMWTDGKTSKLFKANETPPEGWVKGRKMNPLHPIS